MVTAPASEVQKNFGEWHDRAYEGPVEITRYGRTTAYLISAPLFKEMWESFRRAVPTGSVSEEDINLVLNSVVDTDRPYNLSDIVEDK